MGATKPSSPLLDPSQRRPTIDLQHLDVSTSKSPSPSQTRWVHVNVGSATDYVNQEARQFGKSIEIRVVTDDEQALWRFFEVRKEQFTEGLQAAIQTASEGKAVLQSVEYRHGSLMIAMLVIAVVGQYPQLKQNLPIIASDIGEIIDQIETSVLPRVKAWIEGYFEDYKEVPLVRLAKSIWKALFG